MWKVKFAKKILDIENKPMLTRIKNKMQKKTL